MFERIVSLPVKWHMAILLLLVAVVFGSTISNDFVWDDKVLILDNPVYRNADFKTIFTGLANGLEYLPVRDLSFLLDYQLWGYHPAGWHATNLLLHAGIVLVVYFLSVRLCRLLKAGPETGDGDDGADRTLALLVAMLFAVHPLAVQTVAFVTQRNTLLAALFAFASTSLFLRFMQSSARQALTPYLLSLGCYLLALLSKANTLSLPLLLLAVAVIRRAEGRKRIIAAIIPFMLLAFPFSVMFKTVARSTGVVNDNFLQFGGGSLVSRLWAAAQIPYFYVGKFLAPLHLLPSYEVNFARTLASPLTIGALTGLALAVAGALLAVRRFPLLATGLAWYLIMLIPVLNLLPSNPVVADRYVFLPMYGLCLVAGWGLSTLLRRYRRATAVCAGIWVTGCALLAIAETGAWRSEEALWLHAQRIDPGSEMFCSQLGAYYEDSGQYDKAREQYRRVVEIEPFSYKLRLFEAHEAFRKKDYQKAAEQYRLVLRTKDMIPGALYNLGQVYEELGRPEEAMRAYTRFLKPDSGEARVTVRAKAQRRLDNLWRRYENELALLRADVNRNPADWKLRFAYAFRLDTLGMYNEAVAEYQAVANSGGGGWQVWYNLGNAQVHLARYDDAIVSFGKSVGLNPAYPDAWNNLGSALRLTGRVARSLECFRKAVELSPTFAYAQFNLAQALFQMGNRDGAIAQFRLVRERFPDLAPNVQSLEYVLARER